MGSRTRVCADANGSVHLRQNSRRWGFFAAAARSTHANSAHRPPIRSLPMRPTNAKTKNTPYELHSAARHVSGFLQVVPIETASERTFQRLPSIARPRHSR
jgi:hypothetical protein